MKTETKARKAKEASRKLSQMSAEQRNNELTRIREAIEENKEEILEANKKDLSEAKKKLKEEEDYSQVLVDRLKLESKLESVKEMVSGVIDQEEIVGKKLEERKLDDDLKLEKVSTPLGVIGTVFESRPDALVQIASLCLKSGNSVLLKGGSEASATNRKLYQTIKEATDVEGWIQLLETHEEVDDLLKLDEYVDLIIPRGSKGLVSHVQENTSIEVLGHAEGLCHLYIDNEAEEEKAVNLTVDAKTDYPAACNSIETLLIHKKKENLTKQIVNSLNDKGVRVLGGEKIQETIGVEQASSEDWNKEYNDYKISVKIVENQKEAINHINKHSSGHTDSIVTENKEKAEKFLERVDSSSVIWNASTRFADGFRYGLGAEVGISTGKTHARGPVGLKGLTTHKYILKGEGNQVSNYSKEDYKHD